MMYGFFSVPQLSSRLVSSLTPNIVSLREMLIESCPGIIVACLVSYPALYKSERQKRVTTESYKMYTPWNGKHSAPRKMTTLDSHDDSYGNEISGNNRQKKGTSRNGSETQLTAHSNQHTESIPLDVINVESRYEVFHSAHG